MGGKVVLPEPDANITKCIKNFRLTPKDISDFWKIFQRLDKAKTGLVSLNVIFKSIEWERNLLTDCLLELLEVEHEGEINFSDFLLMVTTYCFFEPNEILRFCFFTFDQDKTGYFSVDDLNNLINVVHNVKQGKTVQGNVKVSWGKLTFKGEQVDFEEFHQIHNAFPRLFEPAFRLQQQMMIGFMGEVWWNRKKRNNQNFKDEADAKIRKQEEKKEKKKKYKNARKTQRNMGLLKYYLCPCLRSYYDPSLTEYDKMTEEEKIARDKQLATARRQAELKIKNPETAHWQKYQKKLEENEKEVAEAHAGNADGDKEKVVLTVVEQKHLTTERPREQRVTKRAERKKARENDPDLKIKPRNTVSGADI